MSTGAGTTSASSRPSSRARFEAIPRFNTSDALRAFYELYAEKQGKERWGDKTPDYIKRMRRIKRVLPEAHFIHVIRDGRDVTLSTNKRIIERGHRDPLPAKRSARRWRNRIEKARADSPRLGEYLEIRYEDLVIDTEPTLRRVCEFIELEFEPAMLRYHETAAERLPGDGRSDAREGRASRARGRRAAEGPRACHQASDQGADRGLARGHERRRPGRVRATWRASCSTIWATPEHRPRSI